MSADLSQRALEAYELAYERVVLARQSWAEAGSRFTLTRPVGIVVQHPLSRVRRGEAASERAPSESMGASRDRDQP